MGEGLKDFWVPLPLGVKLLGGLLAWKKVSPAPALFANPSHLPWLALGGTSTFDLFAKLPVSTETKEGLEGAQALPSGKPSSPVGKQEAEDDAALGNEGPSQGRPLSSSSCIVTNPSPSPFVFQSWTCLETLSPVPSKMVPRSQMPLT